ncbi:hypothetical protein L914_21265 [Phytophthora nicotianae]|uniref:RxLR effector protein n=2 Tax=Phytophthora nicotianae TaxID=4792 RepID=W2M3X9_PHYNI|nr:hypothetical protein L914_21265 [Phytophthora nicotianae]
MTTANLPTKTHMLTDKPVGAPASRVLRESETDETKSEERMMNAAIEKLTSLVKVGTSRTSKNVNWKSLLTGEQPADEVLKVFQLENGLERALTSSNLKAMETYVHEVNKINTNNKVSVIGLFTAHYGDDAVAKALVTAQSNAKTTDEFATIRQLREDQLSAWLSSEKSVDNVFTLLKLREDGYAALASPKMDVLDDYMKLVIRTNSGDETLLQTLTKGFGGEEKLAMLLVLAKDDSRTSELATALQNALLNKWMASKMQPEGVLTTLKLDGGVKDALFNQNLHTLTAFISMYNARNPSSKTSLIETFSAHYGDGVLAKVLYSLRSDQATQVLASKLQMQQFKLWLTSKKSADDVYKLLKIKIDDFLEEINPKLQILDEYVAVLKATNPQVKTDMLAVVSNGFGGEGVLARKIVSMLKQLDSINVDTVTFPATEYQKALFKRWFRSDIKPKSIYSQILKVDEHYATTADIAVVDRYTTYYNKKNQPPNVFTFNDPRRS